MPPTKARARFTKQPPRRGVPYYDVESGRQRIVPPEGGKAVDYVGPSERRGFDARKALRSAGVRSVEHADRIAARAPSSTARALRRANALPDFGGGPSGVGGLLVYAFATIIGLALLENVLGGRGPAGVEKVLGGLGGGLRKLVDPSDPVIGKGTVPAGSVAGAGTVGAAASSSSSSAAGAGAAAVGGKVSVAAGANRPGAPLHHEVVDFVRRVSALFGQPLQIETGTNHSRLTVDGDESAHWTGWAGDVGPFHGTGPQHIDPNLTRAGRAALIAAGMAPAQANRQTGGLFNVGHYQIIFNTFEGGNHFNHLHVGVRPSGQVTGGR